MRALADLMRRRATWIMPVAISAPHTCPVVPTALEQRGHQRSGHTLFYMFNGRLMSVVIDNDAPNRPVDGLSGMQVHVGPAMKVEYRNIRLKNW